MLKVFKYIYTDINNLYQQKFVFLFYMLVAGLTYMFIMRGVFKMLPIINQKLKSVMLDQT